MGKRLHVIKKHEDYGSTEAFNWCFDQFYNLLESLGCEMSTETPETLDRFECTVFDYKQALNVLKRFKKFGNCPSVACVLEEVGYDADSLKEDLDAIGGLDSVIRAMDEFYRDRDKKSSYISFYAW